MRRCKKKHGAFFILNLRGQISALLEEFDKELAAKDAEIAELQARVATGGGGGGAISEEDFNKLEADLLEADAAAELVVFFFSVTILKRHVIRRKLRLLSCRNRSKI